MKAISGIGGASSAWPEAGAARERIRDRMFAKADADGSGGIDKSELQVVLETAARRTGNDALSADEVMTRLDSDGDGSLTQGEVSGGLKKLLPRPASTVDFAQRGSVAKASPAAQPTSADCTATNVVA